MTVAVEDSDYEIEDDEDGKHDVGSWEENYNILVRIVMALIYIAEMVPKVLIFRYCTE